MTTPLTNSQPQSRTIPGDGLRRLALRAQFLRWYGMYAPWERGKTRAAGMLRRELQGAPLGARVEIAARDGRRFRVDPAEPQFWMGLIDRGVFEPRFTSAVRALVKPGGTVIDAGANFGWFTTLLSALVGPRGAVHAFEPMPHTAAILREHCELNACTNVSIVEMALGASPGTAQLFLQSGRPCGDATMFGGAGSHGTMHQCRVTTLDDYVQSHRLERCEMIKCDVEGAELLFVRGASNTIAEFRPVIAIEINPEALARAGCKPSDVLGEIARCADYTFEAIDEGAAPRRIDVTSCDTMVGYVNVVCRAS